MPYQCEKLVILFYLLNLASFDCQSTSDVLTIRHGRSRERHNTEKDKVKWGLKALDNLTLIDDGEIESSENETGGDNSTVIYPEEFKNVTEQNILNNQSSELVNLDGEYALRKLPKQPNKFPLTTTIPLWPAKKKIGKKKDIMANIKNTVDKGIEYLKSHQNFHNILHHNSSTVKGITGINNIKIAKSIKSRGNKRSQANLKTDLQKEIKTNEPVDGNSKNEPFSIMKVFRDNPVESQPIKSIQSVQSSTFFHHAESRQSLQSATPTINPVDMEDKEAWKDNLMLNDQAEHDSADIADMPNTQNRPNAPIKKQFNQHFKKSVAPSLDDKQTEQKHDLHNQMRLPANEVDMDLNIFVRENDSFNEHQQDEAGSDLDNSDNAADNTDNFENADSVNMGWDEKNNQNDFTLDENDLEFDEASQLNRKSLLRGRDVLTRFLQIVESQHALGGNCTAGTDLSLGEGVVDRYAQDRFRIEAEVAVNRANMLTRIFKLTSPAVQEDINLLHASVLSMVEFDDDIFGAGHCFDWNQHPSKRGLFCPFAHRLPAPETAMLAKNLANEYHYLGNSSEWFFLARKNAEKVVARNEPYIKAYHSYSNDTERHAEEILSVRYEDGKWSKPYYDCGGGNIWMLTYTVPFFGFENGTYFFKGTSGIDVDLRRVDIDQCPQKNTVTSSGAPQPPLNIFAGTDKCKQRTTECLPIPSMGFRRGSYKCICRKGFYYPDPKMEQRYFNGSTLEEEYAKLMQDETSAYSEPNSFECLPCAEGCDYCEDSSPCVAELNWPMRTAILLMAIAVIGFLPPAVVFTFRYQQVKVVRAASPALLRVIALGAFLIYCTSIVMYPPPSIYTCTARIWLREIGFSLTYGALMLKTWRISVIFRIRSAKAVKITDASLIKKLGILCCFVGVALLIRTLVAPPVVIVGRTADNLKAFLCKTDWWDHTFTSLEVLFLAWGVRLCIVVRKAPSEFNESRFISMAIYNEFLLTCFLNVSMLFLQSPANPDLLYIIFFCHCQLTVTLLLALIFGSKVYLVYRSGGKALEESMNNKQTGAKFISRSQIRTFASASSVTASTGQLHPPAGTENRLNEHEALEEIKQLINQLQRLYDRIPQRGAATNVILTLIDVCKGSSSNNNQLAIKSAPQAPLKPICDSTDKETNTSIESLVWQRQLQAANGCQFIISDNCDNQIVKANSKSCSEKINCSSNSINYENLKLPCMCSSDSSIPDEFPMETCHNCHARLKQPHSNGRSTAGNGNSFRDKLINFTNQNNHTYQNYPNQPPQRVSNSLVKRNSELVLGTNFENMGNKLYRNKNTKSYDSCDNIYLNRPPTEVKVKESRKMMNCDPIVNSNYQPDEEERPSLKLSQSDDTNLKELKKALSTSLAPANNKSNCNVTNRVLVRQQNSQNSQKSHKAQSCTLTSSKTAAAQKDLAQHKDVRDVLTNDCEAINPLPDQSINLNELDDEPAASENSADTTTSQHTEDNVGITQSNGKKRKSPESKLALDLNDRSKFTEGVSV